MKKKIFALVILGATVLYTFNYFKESATKSKNFATELTSVDFVEKINIASHDVIGFQDILHKIVFDSTSPDLMAKLPAEFQRVGLCFLNRASRGGDKYVEDPKATLPYSAKQNEFWILK